MPTNHKAWLAIADILATGAGGRLDPRGAIAAYEEAGKLGSTAAWNSLGTLYRFGLVVPRSKKKALTYFQRTVDAPDGWGAYGLGSMLLEFGAGRGAGGQSALDLLSKAEAAGVADAVAELARAYLLGLGVRPDTNAAVSLLTKAAEGGNQIAIAKLIAIYRDGVRTGRRTIVRADISKARSMLDRYGEKLDRGTLLSQQLLLDVARNPSQAPSTIMAKISELSPGMQRSLLRDLVDASPDGYTRLIQLKFNELGLRVSPVSGKLNRNTASAMSTYCKRQGVQALCRMGPMSSPSATIFARAFVERTSEDGTAQNGEQPARQPP
jgi:hypothetical protein